MEKQQQIYHIYSAGEYQDISGPKFDHSLPSPVFFAGAECSGHFFFLYRPWFVSFTIKKA